MIIIPKIIDDAKQTILNEAKRQVLENGYQNMTIRSVAKECNIAVGTIYNYYKSKDILTASFMLDDWLQVLEKMKSGCKKADKPEEYFSCIYSELISFDKRYSELFKNSDATKNSVAEFPERHRQLRSQLSVLIKDMCKEKAKNYTEFLPEFIAESLLSWSTENRPYKDVEEILNQLF